MPMTADQSQTQTASLVDLDAIFVSLELSKSTWLVTALSPCSEKMSRYAQRGLIEISLCVERNEVILRVADEGPGLAPDIAASAFEPFRRGGESGSLEKGGNGLGLSVVRAIVEAHGGKVQYTKSDTGGAMFEMVIGEAVS